MKDMCKHFVVFIAVIFFYPLIKYAVDKGWKPESKKLRAMIYILDIISFFFWLFLVLCAVYMLKTIAFGL